MAPRNQLMASSVTTMYAQVEPGVDVAQEWCTPVLMTAGSSSTCDLLDAGWRSSSRQSVAATEHQHRTRHRRLRVDPELSV